MEEKEKNDLMLSENVETLTACINKLLVGVSILCLLEALIRDLSDNL